MGTGLAGMEGLSHLLESGPEAGGEAGSLGFQDPGLGEGARGIVYEADDPAFDRSVAIKVLKPSLLADAIALVHEHLDGHDIGRFVEVTPVIETLDLQARINNIFGRVKDSVIMIDADHSDEVRRFAAVQLCTLGPGLEIEADDVVCTHASAIGRLDEEELFYLMSRGIPRADAVRLIVEGFFQPSLDRLPKTLEGLRGRLVEAIADKLRA